MSIRKKIEDNLQLALKEKNRTLISTLRLIMAGIKDKDIACRSKDNKEGFRWMYTQKKIVYYECKKMGREDLLEVKFSNFKNISFDNIIFL